MGTKQTTSRFALMRHGPSGGDYAIEYDETDSRIVRIIGPLHYSQVRDSLGVVFPETSPHWLEIQDAFDGADALEDVDWAGTQQWELVTLMRPDSHKGHTPPGKTVSQGTVHAPGKTPSTPPPPAGGGGGDHRKRKGKQVV